jgi:hypothetical protein
LVPYNSSTNRKEKRSMGPEGCRLDLTTTCFSFLFFYLQASLENQRPKRDPNRPNFSSLSRLLWKTMDQERIPIGYFFQPKPFRAIQEARAVRQQNEALCFCGPQHPLQPLLATDPCASLQLPPFPLNPALRVNGARLAMSHTQQQSTCRLLGGRLRLGLAALFGGPVFLAVAVGAFRVGVVIS